MWVHMRLNCHAHLCTLVPVWMWWLYGLGQIDMQYISMATLLQRGHEASVCSRGTKLILSSSKRSQNHTTSIHTSTVWLISQCMAQQQVSSHASRFMCKAEDFYFFLSSFFFFLQFNESALPLIHFKSKTPRDDARQSNYRHESKAHYGLPWKPWVIWKTLS